MSARDGGREEGDPLADLVSRSIGARVPSVEVELLASGPEGERKRLRFTSDAGASSAIFDRAPRGDTTEAQLLPFLARRSDRLPIVYSRGIPPAHVTLGPWILLEDVFAGGSACDDDPRQILRAKLAIEQAVAKDPPALRALGLRDDPRPLSASLAAAPRSLVHGDLVCANAQRTARGTVLTGWRRAMLGPAVLDVASLVIDLERSDRRAAAATVREAYVALDGQAGAARLLEEAERFQRAGARR